MVFFLIFYEKPFPFQNFDRSVKSCTDVVIIVIIITIIIIILRE